MKKSKTRTQIQSELDESKTQVDRARLIIDHALEGVAGFMSIPAILQWASDNNINPYLSVSGLEQHVTCLTSGKYGPINFVSVRSKGLGLKGVNTAPVIKATARRAKASRKKRVKA